MIARVIRRYLRRQMCPPRVVLWGARSGDWTVGAEPTIQIAPDASFPRGPVSVMIGNSSKPQWVYVR